VLRRRADRRLQQLGDCLGKGAFGSVYRALNWGTGETVAIKQVKLVDLPKGQSRAIMVSSNLHQASTLESQALTRTRRWR
jgi:serine/threonine protein kinase